MYKQHRWRHAPANSKAFWKCADCEQLDFNAIPDTDETCPIDNEPEDSTYTQEFDDFTDADQGL